MIISSSVGRCGGSALLPSQHLQSCAKCQSLGGVSGSSSNSCSLVVSQGCRATINSCISVSSPALRTWLRGFQALRQISDRSLSRKWGNNLEVKSWVGSSKSREACVDVSFGSKFRTRAFRRLEARGVISGLKCWPCRKRPSLTQEYSFLGLLLGSFICFSSSDASHMDALLEEEEEQEGRNDPSSVHLSHGKKVYTAYSVIGIPGDGRCLFRSVAHGACLRSGRPAPSERIQREVADELRGKVADEFIRRREETEWFIEGDFDTYVSRIRKPQVWGGEPELLMLSHVLKMPITVYMRDANTDGLISIAEYGQGYGKGDHPIRVLYHGSGHYDALRFPGDGGF